MVSLIHLFKSVLGERHAIKIVEEPSSYG